MSTEWISADNPPPEETTTVWWLQDDGTIGPPVEDLPPQSLDMLVLADDGENGPQPFVAAYDWRMKEWVFQAHEKDGIGLHYQENSALVVKWWRPIPPKPKD